jgi:uncharacterized membrane protein
MQSISAGHWTALATVTVFTNPIVGMVMTLAPGAILWVISQIGHALSTIIVMSPATAGGVRD